MKKLLIAFGALLLLVVAASALLTSGPGGSGQDDRAVPGPASLTDRDASAGQEGPSTSSADVERDSTGTPPESELREPAVIRTGAIGIHSDRVVRDLRRVREVATALEGSVTSESTSSNDGQTWAELTLRVPHAQFDPAMTRLEKIGEVTHREVGSDDVTTQVIDIDSRVRAQRASVTSLEKLMARARTVGEVMSVERELAQRQGALDSLVQQQRYLADQTAMATISVSLSEDEGDVTEPDAGFVGGLERGWAALGALLTGAATFLGMLLPFVPVLLLVGVVAAWALRRRRTRATAE